MQETTNLQDLMKALTRSASGEIKRPAQQENRYSACTDAIMAYILKRGLRPGDPLPRETQLSEMLQVSRSSLREAIRRLETLRIVEAVHGRGTFVGDFSLSPLLQTLTFRSLLSGGEDLSQLRSVVEMRQMLDLGSSEEIVGSFGAHPERELLGQRLAELAERMEEQARGAQSFEDLDLEFHTTLWECSENQLLQQLSYTLWLVHMAVNTRLEIPVSSALSETAQSHRVLLEALLAGDGEAYRRGVKEHYTCIMRAIKRA